MLCLLVCLCCLACRHLIWLSLDRSAGYRMDYPYVLLHAVSRDTSTFPHACLYAQLDDEVAEEAFASASMRQSALPAAAAAAASSSAAAAADEEDEEDEPEEEQPISELRFVPENAGICKRAAQQTHAASSAADSAIGSVCARLLTCVSCVVLFSVCMWLMRVCSGRVVQGRE